MLRPPFTDTLRLAFRARLPAASVADAIAVNRRRGARFNFVFARRVSFTVTAVRRPATVLTVARPITTAFFDFDRPYRLAVVPSMRS